MAITFDPNLYCATCTCGFCTEVPKRAIQNGETLALRLEDITIKHRCRTFPNSRSKRRTAANIEDRWAELFKPYKDQLS